LMLAEEEEREEIQKKKEVLILIKRGRGDRQRSCTKGRYKTWKNKRGKKKQWFRRTHKKEKGRGKSSPREGNHLYLLQIPREKKCSLIKKKQKRGSRRGNISNLFGKVNGEGRKETGSIFPIGGGKEQDERKRGIYARRSRKEPRFYVSKKKERKSRGGEKARPYKKITGKGEIRQ